MSWSFGADAVLCVARTLDSKLSVALFQSELAPLVLPASAACFCATSTRSCARDSIHVAVLALNSFRPLRSFLVVGGPGSLFLEVSCNIENATCILSVLVHGAVTDVLFDGLCATASRILA